jgi:GNAT superfamily N-acetyltransferase
MNVAVRKATVEDLEFARALYLESMREISASVFPWDENRQIARLNAGFAPGEVSIFTLGGEDIGWYQLGESDDEIFLKQFFVRADHRGRGIGTELLRALLDRAAKAGKMVRLGVVKANRARSLYERHGFRTVSVDAYKFYMETTKPLERP